MSSAQDQSKNQKCFIQILPDEILSTIFDVGCGSATLYDELSFPMVVSTVSLLWRQVAISTPSLWTSIFVDFFNQKSFSCNIPLFFERSKVQPLHITIRFSYPPFTSRSYKGLSEAISRNACRICEIVVCIQSLSDFHDFASPFNTLTFPILSRLEIDSNARQCLSNHVPLFTGAIHIRSMVFPRCPTCAPLGPDLTHLEVRRLTCNVEQLRAIFQASPSLHTLTIYKFGNDGWGQFNPLPIVASSLHTLNITIHDDHSSDGVCTCPLPHLVTPNLVILAVKSSYGDFPFIQHFSALPKIEKLKIVGFVLTPEDGLVIQHWTTLTHVELIKTDHTYLWSNPKINDPSDIDKSWQNLTTVTLGDPSFAGRAQMVKAIRRSYTQSPRTITLNIDKWYRYHLEELRSELPNAVLNFIEPDFDPLIYYDTSEAEEEYDNEDDDDWSDGSGNYYGDVPGIDDIDYELDAELDPYSHYYDDDDSFDEEE